ncbi:MAG: hypothetical protein F4Y14_19470 [Acidobacteria bacterium]|nr:hypothetical protein [Acidobacteriota bacterium]
MTIVAGLITGIGIALALVSNASASDSPESRTEVRIAARVLPDEGKEFAIQVRPAGGAWEGRQLPSARLVPADATASRWVASTPLALDTHAGANGDDKDAPATVRILARRVEDGRTEVALQIRRGGEEWGDLQMPCQRFLPVQAPPSRWFVTSPLTVPGGATESPSGSRQSSRPTPRGIVPMFGVCENEEREWLRAVREDFDYLVEVWLRDLVVVAFWLIEHPSHFNHDDVLRAHLWQTLEALEEVQVRLDAHIHAVPTERMRPMASEMGTLGVRLRIVNSLFEVALEDDPSNPDPRVEGVLEQAISEVGEVSGQIGWAYATVKTYCGGNMVSS